MQYMVIESNGELVMLSAPQWKVLQQAKSGRFVQANVLTLRKLADMGFLENVQYLKVGGGDPKPYADFTEKARMIVHPPSVAAIRTLAPFARSKRRKTKARVLVVFDGEHWFSRKLKTSAHRIDAELGIDEMVYRCDDLSGPHATIDDAVTWLRQNGLVP